MGEEADYWHRHDDSMEARHRAEHGMTASFGPDGSMVLNAGNEALLPQWPPTVNLPGLVVPLSAEPPPPPVDTCEGCRTRITLRDGSWRHEVGWRDRRGCGYPRPAGCGDG